MGRLGYAEDGLLNLNADDGVGLKGIYKGKQQAEIGAGAFVLFNCEVLRVYSASSPEDSQNQPGFA